MGKQKLIDSLDAFTRAYIECALWSSTDEKEVPLDNYAIEEITLSCLKQMIKDCKDFQEAQAKDLALSGQSAEYSGHDFWLTRNGHGAGFWDRGLGAVGDRLSEACRPYGSVYLYVFRGKVYHG